MVYSINKLLIEAKHNKVGEDIAKQLETWAWAWRVIIWLVNSEWSDMHFVVPLYKFELIFYSEIEISNLWSSKNGPKGGTWKKWKWALKKTFPSVLLTNKHTFFSETFNFLQEPTFLFFYFCPLKRIFRVFSKKTKTAYINPNLDFLINPNSWAEST